MKPYVWGFLEDQGAGRDAGALFSGKMRGLQQPALFCMSTSFSKVPFYPAVRARESCADLQSGYFSAETDFAKIKIDMKCVSSFTL